AAIHFVQSQVGLGPVDAVRGQCDAGSFSISTVATRIAYPTIVGFIDRPILENGAVGAKVPLPAFVKIEHGSFVDGVVHSEVDILQFIDDVMVEKKLAIRANL